MIDNIDITKVLFLDIETVSAEKSYEDLSDTFKELWQIKCKTILREYEEEISEDRAIALYTEKAGIYAEFGKIVCISVGLVHRDAKTRELGIRLKSFVSDDESALLKDFAKLVEQYYNNINTHFLCGHNIKEFDLPYISRRMVVNQLPMPNAINVTGKKPWETNNLLDTMALWKFGDFKAYTSLKLLMGLFGLPSPKDDIDGSDVGRVYWQERDLPRIATYCEKDVLAVAQLLLKYMRLAPMEEGQVVVV